ncbi:MAG: dienelactone hydrolase family protein [Vicinamibacterales bacterium]
MPPHEGQALFTAGAAISNTGHVVLMLHGRGASPQDILGLVPHLDCPAATYLAPAAANRTWYPLSFLSEISRNEPDLSSALCVVEQIVQDCEQRGIKRDRIVLLGFSQGACLAAEFAVRHPGRWGGVVVFSGGLIGPPGTTWDTTGDFAGTPVFLGCSDVDAHIPKTRVEESAVVFSRMGADVTTRIYPGMGHTVNDDEIEHARKMLKSIAQQKETGSSQYSKEDPVS